MSQSESQEPTMEYSGDRLDLRDDMPTLEKMSDLETDSEEESTQHTGVELAEEYITIDVVGDMNAFQPTVPLGSDPHESSDKTIQPAQGDLPSRIEPSDKCHQKRSKRHLHTCPLDRCSKRCKHIQRHFTMVHLPSFMRREDEICTWQLHRFMHFLCRQLGLTTLEELLQAVLHHHLYTGI
jgi:hypothetical protein